MEQIIKALKTKGAIINEETLSHISVLPYKYIIPIGTYFVKGGYEREMI